MNEDGTVDEVKATGVVPDDSSPITLEETIEAQQTPIAEVDEVVVPAYEQYVQNDPDDASVDPEPEPEAPQTLEEARAAQRAGNAL